MEIVKSIIKNGIKMELKLTSRFFIKIILEPTVPVKPPLIKEGS